MQSPVASSKFASLHKRRSALPVSMQCCLEARAEVYMKPKGLPPATAIML